VHSELVRNANALLTERPDEISTAGWVQYAGELARQDRIGAAVIPWGDLDAAYSKMLSIKERRTEPSSQFAGAVQTLADNVLDIAARAFDVHFTLSLPPPPSDAEIRELGPGAAAALPELPVSKAVEQAITSARLGRRRRVRRALKQSSVFGLGRPAGDTSTPGQGTEADLVHSTIDSSGRDYEILPIFTRDSYLASAIQLNRDLMGTFVLKLEGSALVKEVHSDVNLVINPWSPAQFILPAKRRRARLR
jgi:hypothetical protein